MKAVPKDAIIRVVLPPAASRAIAALMFKNLEAPEGVLEVPSRRLQRNCSQYQKDYPRRPRASRAHRKRATGKERGTKKEVLGSSLSAAFIKMSPICEEKIGHDRLVNNGS